MKDDSLPWWEQRRTVAALVVLSMLPFLWPDVPPLTDLPGHLGRYKIQLDLQDSPSLQRFYDFQWSLIPNLGVDLLIVPLARLFGIEVAAKIVVVLIPPLTLSGFLWAAKEAHSRLSPSWLFAAPLIYAYPFLYGFLNFALSMAFAFIALGLWLRLGRLGRFRLRASLAVPLSFGIWITHAFGWGALGLLVFACELAREMPHRPFSRAAPAAALRCLPLAGPLLPMLAWQGRAAAGANDWFNIEWKVTALVTVFRDRWAVLDIASAALLVVLVFAGVRDRRLEFSPLLAASAVALLATFILLPRLLLGGAHTDDRMAPYLYAVAVLAVRPAATASPRFVKALAATGLAFFLVRIAAVSLSAALYDRSYDTQLRALDEVPRGARLVAFVGMRCDPVWASSRLEHLPGLAIVRREAFANDQWTVPGSHLLRVRPPWTRYVDPSQMVAEQACEGVTVEAALASIRQEDFDYVWLIEVPPHDAPQTRDWTPVWRHGSSVLFRLPQEEASEGAGPGPPNAGPPPSRADRDPITFP